MPSDESKGSQLDAIGSLAQRQLDNTWHLVAERCFPCAYGEPESPTSPPTRPRSGARHGSMTIETARRAGLEFVCVFWTGRAPASGRRLPAWFSVTSHKLSRRATSS